MLSESTYPVILIHEKLLEYKVFFPLKHDLPLFPKKRTPEKEPNAKWYKFIRFFCYLCYALFFVSILTIVFVPFVMIITVLSIFLAGWLMDYKDKLKQEIDLFNLLNKRYSAFNDRDYNSQSHIDLEYDIAQKLYVTECERIHQLNKELEDEGKLKQIRINRQINYLKDSKFPKKSIVAVETKKGRSELMFLNHLKGKYEKQIIVDSILGIYVPDFILYFEEFNLYIDIEIDEPYTVDGNPIHYIDAVGNSIDNDRDQFFLSSKWVVIRFAEQQIYNQPLNCVKCIEDVINCIFMKSRQINHNVKEVLRWNKEESEELYKMKYRGFY